MINTGLLTDLILDTMSAAGVLVGDGVAPQEGGWMQGAPNVESYRAYTVVAYDGGQPAMEGVTQYPEWLVTIAMRHYGGSRMQVDWQSDTARNALMTVDRLQFDEHKVAGIQWRTLGGVSRVDQTDPSSWQAFDSVALHCVVVR